MKISNQLGMMRPVEVRRREFEVLNKLNHENIVKLYASETEVSSHCYYFKALIGLDRSISPDTAENMTMKTASV